MSIEYLKNSEKTWNAIARSFDITRRKPWIQCINFINSLPETHIVADIGCGNGRHLIPSAKRCKTALGLDISGELLSIVLRKIQKQNLKNVSLLHSDVVNIPLENNSIDSVLFIAALHNIQGKDKRVKSLKEVKRILKKDGKALISVWSRSQDKYKKMFFKKPSNQEKNTDFGDIDIYWRQHGLNIPRFYHLYSKQEFLNDLKKAGLKIIEFQDVKIRAKKHPDNYFAKVTLK
jgi:alkylated DNA repair protein alkB family protein 8